MGHFIFTLIFIFLFTFLTLKSSKLLLNLLQTLWVFDSHQNLCKTWSRSLIFLSTLSLSFLFVFMKWSSCFLIQKLNRHCQIFFLCFHQFFSQVSAILEEWDNDYFW